MDNRDFYKELIKRYEGKTATKEEELVFFNLLRAGKIDPVLIKHMDEQLEEDLNKSIFSAQKKTKHPSLFKYAATIILLVTGMIVYYIIHTSNAVKEISLAGNTELYDIPAGTNRAILTLDDGSQIPLDSVSSDRLRGAIEIKFNNHKEGLLVYNAAQSTDSVVRYHEVQVPLGGQYQVILPDQSKVWLNAGSKLRFPTTFPANKREVFLAGEGYFEVKSAIKPFFVNTAAQQVQVLGTAFNIKAYTDEQRTFTTLLSGSVKVKMTAEPSTGTIIKPNQQAVSNPDDRALAISQVEAKDFVAWKEGFFVFQHTPLDEAMQQIARWYDVEIAVKQMPKKSLYAVLPKNVKLSELLEMIDLTSNTKFKIVGRRVFL